MKQLPPQYPRIHRQPRAMSSPASSLLAKSRRLLLPDSLSGYRSAPQAWAAAGCPPSGRGPSSADSNVVMILVVLLCVLVCALGLNSFFRCLLRWSSQMAEEPMANPVVRLAQAGQRRRALQRLPTLHYSPGLKLAGSDPAECAICLAEFAQGEEVRLLPKCGHGFHLKCIDRWLTARSSCPTCRTRCLFGGREKASGCGAASGGSRSDGTPAAAAQSAIVPLEPEYMITRYHFWSHQAIFAV